MSFEISIKDILNQGGIDPNQRLEIRGRVISNYENCYFSFADPSCTVIVKADPSFINGYQIGCGKYFKLINPELDQDGKGLVLTARSKIMPTRRIHALEGLALKVQEVDSSQSNLAAIGKLDPNQVSSNFMLIVFNL